MVRRRVLLPEFRLGGLADGGRRPFAFVGEPFPGRGDLNQQFTAFAGLQAIGELAIFVRIPPILVRILLVDAVLHVGAPQLPGKPNQVRLPGR